ncbi:hypothetical protein [Demequina litorisediminis]|uniref:hypothetical protein n=1 Tax=Demequina litorisediminis TaxID=1849022 RepID=UPI0024E060E7|nr:hypothetical protein [Demequina litorisediminis]
MPLDVNPLIPTTYDLIWSVVAAAVLVVTISAAVSVIRHQRVLSLARNRRVAPGDPVRAAAGRHRVVPRRAPPGAGRHGRALPRDRSLALTAQSGAEYSTTRAR